MTPEALDLWLKIASSALSIAAFGFALVAARRKAINERLDAGSKRMDAHDLAIQAMQTQIAGMPGKEDLHRMELSIAGMAGDLKEMRAGVAANGDQLARFITVLERHEDHLLSGGKG
ncbi:MAG: DUF2730 family protein [Rhodobacter sp.]|nr:DUF2730 family protein [Rhodobacter sp.]